MLPRSSNVYLLLKHVLHIKPPDQTLSRYFMHCTHVHTHNMKAQSWRDVIWLPKTFPFFLKVFQTSSQCASAFCLSSSCKDSFFTWGYFCSIMYGAGIKTIAEVASLFPCLSLSRVGTRRQMACESGTQQGTPLGHPLI